MQEAHKLEAAERCQIKVREQGRAKWISQREVGNPMNLGVGEMVGEGQLTLKVIN